MPESITLEILGKWHPYTVGDFDDKSYNDGTNPALPAPETLMYVAKVVDNALTYADILLDPDGLLVATLEPDPVLCRLLKGNTSLFEFEVGAWISAYAVEDIYYTVKTKVDKFYGKIQGKHLGGELATGFDPEFDPQPDTLEYVVRLYTEEELGDAIAWSDDPLPAPTGDYELVRQLTGEASRTLAADTFVEVSYIDEEAAMNVVTAAGTTVPCRINEKVAGMTYTYKADIYENGREEGVPPTLLATETGQVEQVNINADQTIPDGTWAMASLNSNGIWYVQVAVWL